MTDILKTTGEDLARLAGEMLQPEKNTHIESDTATPGMSNFNYICEKCNREIAFEEESMCIPDPIPITWPNVMKWRDWCKVNHGIGGFMKSLERVYEASGSWFTFETWLGSDLRPTHIMQAVLKTVERSKR